MKYEKQVPRLILALCALNLIWALRIPSRKGLDIGGFGSLPVLHEGRVKPLDTAARSSLLMISGRQSLNVEGRRMSASQWLLEVVSRPEAADAYPVFTVDNPDLKGLLGSGRETPKRLAFWQIAPFLDQIEAQASRAMRLEDHQRSRFQSAVVNLQQRLMLYQGLKNTLQVEGTKDMAAELEEYSRALPAGVAAVKAHVKGGSFDRKALERLNAFFERYRFLSQAAQLRALPPLSGERPQDWTAMGEGLLGIMREELLHPGVSAYARLTRAYRRSDAREFDGALAVYRRYLDERIPRSTAWAGREATFNHVQPFYQGMILYLAALILAFAAWLMRPEMLRRSAYQVLLLAFAVHTAGLAFRVLLQGRPPVTNLYSSAVFVGWIAVLLGIILERMYRRGFGTVTASAIGFSTLIIAHHLAGQGDTVEMMRAVLDSNFWLATHVVSITIGYGSTFLAAALAHVYIFRRLLARSSDPEGERSLVAMTYGVICFSLFFSFVGTVLGGIWADQSWGRFWGWDPKENGALLIVLWNALILHARWGGYVRERGLMLMAVFGAIVTSLSWFGVNMLGIGLHSYGFMDKAFYALTAFIAAELGVMALGSLPSRSLSTISPSRV